MDCLFKIAGTIKKKKYCDILKENLPGIVLEDNVLLNNVIRMQLAQRQQDHLKKIAIFGFRSDETKIELFG